jgi:hypothetical protein
MKKLIMFLLFVSFAALLQGQFEKTNPISMIGISSNIGINRVVRFEPVFGDESTYDGKTAVSYGINYFRSLSPKIRVQVGAYYSTFKVRFGFPITLFPEGLTLMETLHTVTVPILVNAYSKKNFFVSFGPIVDFNLPRERSRFTDTQDGVGFSLAAGKEFTINKFTIDLSPSLEIHSLFPFSSVLGQQRFFVYAVKLGFNLNLDK